MEADLVWQSHIPHNFIHNLESAFWVLLWAALSYRPTTWKAEERSSFLKETMNPRIYNNSGGRAKLFFMQSDMLADFEVIENPVLTELLRGRKKTFSVRHQQRPSEPSELDPLAIKAEAEGAAASQTTSEQCTALLNKI